MYGFTAVGGKRPYALAFFLPGKRFERQADKLLETIPGRKRVVANPEKRVRQYKKLLEENNFVYFGGADHFLKELKIRDKANWGKIYCPMCADKTCRAGSTQIFRCNQVAEYIGSLDEIEMADIYNLYAAKGQSLYDCFVKIAESEDVGDILKKARPRWPDAF